LIHENQTVKHRLTTRIEGLLAYLFLYRNTLDKPHHMAFLLWDNSSDRQARTNPRKAIHLLGQQFSALEQFVNINRTEFFWQTITSARLDDENLEKHLALPDRTEGSEK